MAYADVKVSEVTVTLTIAGPEAIALHALLAHCNNDSPTDGIFAALMEVWDSLPKPVGDWDIERDLITFKLHN